MIKDVIRLYKGLMHIFVIFMRASLTRPNVTPNKTAESARSSSAMQLTPSQLSYNPSPEDLTLVASIKNDFEIIIAKSKKVIEENETIYGIQTTYQDIVKQTQNSYQTFYSATSSYFNQHQTLRLTAVTNQVISSASCRIPTQNFGKDWNSFSKQIDQLADSHPPPHIAEIQIRFQSIVTAIEIIETSNARRRFPSLTLNGCVRSISNLNSSLKEKITDLFMQPTFPRFEGNVLKSYCDEMLTYKQVLTDAFSNEFVQSGIMPSDLSRIRGNIFSDVDDVIKLIQSSFVFPDEMKEIQEQKNSLDKTLNLVFQKLAIPFAVVKPLHPLTPTKKVQDDYEPLQPKPPPKDYKEEAELLEFIIQQIRDITDFDFSETKKDAVDEIITYYLNQENLNSSQSTEISNLRSALDEQKHKSEEEIELLKQKLEILTNHYEEAKSDVIKLTQKCQQYEKKTNEHTELITNQQNEIERLTKLGNPSFLRKHIRRVLGNEKDESQDEELIEKLKNYINKIKNKACPKCEAKDDELYNIKMKLQSVTGDSELNYFDAIDLLNNNILRLQNDIKNISENENELHNALYSIACNECQTARINGEKINAMSVSQVSEHILHRIKILKRNSVSAEEMAQRMFIDFHGKLVSIINDYNNITKEELEIPALGQTDEEKDASIVKLIEITKNLKTKIDEILEEKLIEKNNLQEKINELESELGQFGKRMLDALDAKTDCQDNNKMVEIAFQELRNIQAPYLKKIGDLENRQKELINGINSIYSRTCSICSIESKDMDPDKQIEKMHEEFNVLKDKISKNDSVIAKFESRIDNFRNNIASVIITMCTAAEGDLTQDMNEMTDEEIIEELKRFSTIMVSPNYSSSFVSADRIMEIISSVSNLFKDRNPEDPLDFLKLIVKRLDEQEKAITMIVNCSPILDSMLRKLSDLEKYQKAVDGLTSTKNHLNKLRVQIEKISQVTKAPNLISFIRSLSMIADMILNWTLTMI